MAEKKFSNTSAEQAAKNAVAPNVASATATPKDSADDFANLTHVSPIIGQRSGGGSLSVNIVRSDGNGKRVKFSKKLHEELGSPTQIQVAQSGNRLFIGETLPNATESFAFSQGKGSTILYRSELVHWLIEAFNLDFDNRVSRSFDKITVKSKEINGSTITYATVIMA